MTDPSLPPSYPKSPIPPSGTAIETFSDLLTDATDLEEICTIALQFALETIGRKSGVLIVQTPQDADIVCQAYSNLSEAWVIQLGDPASPLRKIVQEVLQTGLAITGVNAIRRPSLTALAAAIPISARSAIQGVLLVQDSLCSPIEIDWLTKLSRPIGRAVRLSRTSRASLSRARAQTDLFESLSPAYFGDLESMQVQLLQIVGSLMDAEQAALILLDGNNPDWIIRKALDAQANWIYQVEPLSGSGLLRACLNEHQALRVNDVGADVRFNPLGDVLPGMEARSILLAPLMLEGRLLGAIQVFNKRHDSFTSADQDLLIALASLASSAISGARLVQKMKISDADHRVEELESVNNLSILSALLENLPGYMYVINRSYELVTLSASMARRTGQDRLTSFGSICYRAFYQRSEPCMECMVGETMDKGKGILRTTLRPPTKTSETFTTWEIRSYPVFDRNQNATQAILFEHDISERREMEAVVAQSGKLAALGQLAAGVAHEINNPLTAIIANAQILQRELPPGDERLESVELIGMAGARAAQVVRNLLDFARKEQAQRVLTNINDTLRSSLALVQHELLSRSVSLQFAPDNELPHILAAPESLQGVWLNLLLNALEAIDQPPGIVRVVSQRVGDEVHVSISDNGRGIPSERLERIFEPFYTTKAPGQGTGLGLSVCNQIVEQHNGRISVQSQLGQGTEFVVALPIS